MSLPRARHWLGVCAGGLALVLVLAATVPGQDDDPERRAIRARLDTEARRLAEGRFDADRLDRLFDDFRDRNLLPEVLAVCTEYVKAHANEGEGHFLLGYFEARRGRDRDAMAAFRQAQRAWPDRALPRLYLATALDRAGEIDEALKLLDEVLLKKPTDRELAASYEAKARICLRLRRIPQALAALESLEKLRPGDKALLHQMAMSLAEERQFAQALKRFDTLIAVAAGTAEEVTFRRDRADVLAKAGRSEEAVKALEELIGKLEQANWQRAAAVVRLEELVLETGDLAGLAKRYEAWLKQYPDDRPAELRLAQLLAQLGRGSEASQRLRAVADRAPTDVELRRGLIDLLVAEGDLAGALAQHAEWDRHVPNQVDNLTEWGRLHLRRTDQPEKERAAAAATVWKRLLPGPNETAQPARFDMVGELFLEAGLPEEALPYFQKAADLTTGLSAQRKRLGTVLIGLDRPSDAVAAWKAMLASAPPGSSAALEVAEVFVEHGLRAEARTLLQEMVQTGHLKADDHLRRARLLERVEDYPAALAALDIAAATADEPAREAIFTLRLRIHQATRKVDEFLATLQAATKANPALPSAWLELAQGSATARQWGEALKAAQQAVKLAGPGSVHRYRQEAARIAEAAGDLRAAMALHEQLAAEDKLRRPVHLQNLLRLLERLGRRDQVLTVARQLLDSDPDNIDTVRDYANRCFRFAEDQLGLEALQRVVRMQPDNTAALTALGDAMAERFRTDEAIDWYWKAFDRATPPQRLQYIRRLTALHIRANQFEVLPETLAKKLSGAATRRQLAECRAEAFLEAGDTVSARRELEQLLAAFPTDASLLDRLAVLAEKENDLAGAIDFLLRLVRFRPEAAEYLAVLYLRTGDTASATHWWLRQASSDRDPRRMLMRVDNLLFFKEYKQALQLVERYLREHADDWEATYRRGVALFHLQRRPEAEQAFEALLKLNHDDDEPGRDYQVLQRRGAKGLARPNEKLGDYFRDRMQMTPLIRMTVGLGRGETDDGGGRLWMPADFGQARLAALGWMWRSAQLANTEAAFLKRFPPSPSATQPTERQWRDAYYLHRLREHNRDRYACVKELVKTQEIAFDFYFLHMLSVRTGQDPERNTNEVLKAYDAPVLTPAELAQVRTSFVRLLEIQPKWVDATILQSMKIEFERAGQPKVAYELRQRAFREATNPELLHTVLKHAADENDMEAFFLLFKRLQEVDPLGLTWGNLEGSGVSRTPFLMAYYMALDNSTLLKKPAERKKLINMLLDAYRLRAERILEKRPGAFIGPFAPAGGGQSFYLGEHVFEKNVNMTFPGYGLRIDSQSMYLLANAYVGFVYENNVSSLIEQLQERIRAAGPADRAYEHLYLATVLWWQDDTSGAEREVRQACALAPDDPAIHFEMVRLHELLGRPAEALQELDRITETAPAVLEARENKALEMAEAAGDVERARQAVERLAGLRLSAEDLARLGAAARRLGLSELADALLVRARGRAAGKVDVLLALLRSYQEQDRTDLAIEAARQILRLPSAAEHHKYYARQALSTSGRLPELIARVESQLRIAPHSKELLKNLLDFQIQMGDRAAVRRLMPRLITAARQDADLLAELAGHAFSFLEEDPQALDLYFQAVKLKPTLLFDGRRGDATLSRWMPTIIRLDRMDELIRHMQDLPLATLEENNLAGWIAYLAGPVDTRPLAQFLLEKMLSGATPRGLSYALNSFERQPEIFKLLSRPALASRIEEMALASSGVQSLDADDHLAMLKMHLQLTERAGKAAKMKADVEARLQKEPRWADGRLAMIVLHMKSGQWVQTREAVKAWESNVEPEVRKRYAATLANRLADCAPLDDLALGYFRETVKAATSQGADASLPDSGVLDRLMTLLDRRGQGEESLKLLQEYTQAVLQIRGKNTASSYAQLATYLMQQNLRRGRFDAAVALMKKLPSLTEAVGRHRYYDNPEQNLQQFFVFAPPGDYIFAWLDAVAKQGGAELIDWHGTARSRDTRYSLRPGAPRFYREEMGQSITIEKYAVASLTEQMLERASTDPIVGNRVRAKLREIAQAHSSDVSVLAAQALVELLGDNTTATTSALARLEEAARQVRSGTGKLTNQQTALWCVTRLCLEHAVHRPVGERLLVHCLAWTDKADVSFKISILAEITRLELSRKNLPGAVKCWEQLLEVTLTHATAAKGVVNAEQYSQSIALARWAQMHQAHELTPRVLRAVLAGGPPRAQGEIEEAVVFTDIHDLLEGTRAAGRTTADLYAIAVDLFLPPTRPDQVFDYRATLSNTEEEPRSMGRYCVELAAGAGKLEDLRGRLQARQAQRGAEAAAHAYLGLVGLAAGDFAAVNAELEWLERRVQRQPNAAAYTLASQLAWTALQRKETEAAAAKLATLVVNRVNAAVVAGDSPGADSTLVTKLEMFLIYRDFDLKRPEEGLARVVQHVRRDPQFSNYLYNATVLGHVGRLTEALNYLARAADYGERNLDVGSSAVALEKIYPLLMALPAQERYEVLRKWTFPTSSHYVRHLGGTIEETSVDKPVGFVTTYAWLVEAARAANQLEDLARHATTAAGQQIQGALELQALAEMALGHETTVRELFARQEQRRERRHGFTWPDLALLHGALEHPRWRQDALRQTRRLRDRLQALRTQEAERRDNTIPELPIGFTRLLQDTELREAAGWAPLAAPTFRWWFDVQPPRRFPATAWVEFEGNVTPGFRDAQRRLHCLVPLTGSFDFEFEIAGPGSLEYGGWQFALPQDDRTPSRKVRLQVRPDNLTLFINQKPKTRAVVPRRDWPWLVLTSDPPGAVFRNVRLTGTPTIPREIALQQGRYLGDIGQRSVPLLDTPPDVVPPVPPPSPRDWHYQDGLWRVAPLVLPIHRDVLRTKDSLPVPFQKETVFSYEFYFEANKTEVHPSFGNAAWLLEPDGYTLVGVDDDEFDAPQRHKQKVSLTLHPGAWNTMRVRLEQGSLLALELNGKEIYRGNIPDVGDRTFGLFRRQDRETRVRHGKLQGNWPATLTEGDRQEFLARTQPASTAERAAAFLLMDQSVLLQNAETVLARASKLPAAERYTWLRDWVFPTGRTGPVRLTSPDNPAKSVYQHLLNTAAEVGKLDEVAAWLRTRGMLADRQRIAMLAALFLKQGKVDKARSEIQYLTLLQAQGAVAAYLKDSPFGLVIPYQPAGIDVAMVQYVRQVTTPVAALRDDTARLITVANWQADAALAATLAGIQQPGAALAGTWRLPDAGLERTWANVEGTLTAFTRGRLVYGAPLTGNFVVRGETRVASKMIALPSYGDIGLMLNDQRDLWMYGGQDLSTSISLPDMTWKEGEWIPFELSHQGGILSFSLKGVPRAALRMPPPSSGPWLLFNSGGYGCALRKLSVETKDAGSQVTQLRGSEQTTLFSQYGSFSRWLQTRDQSLYCVAGPNLHDDNYYARVWTLPRPCGAGDVVEFDVHVGKEGVPLDLLLDEALVTLEEKAVQVQPVPWYRDYPPEKLSRLTVRDAQAAGFKPNNWNHVRLTFGVKDVTIEVNASPIARVEYPADFSWTFGLHMRPITGAAYVRQPRLHSPYTLQTGTTELRP